MDSFFASVEERDNPRFRGLPIVVGADPEGGKGRGVVSTANYRAREYGIRSAMPISEAWRMAEAARRAGKPRAVFLSGSFAKYAAVSEEIRAIVGRHASAIEQVSVDEFFADLSSAGSYERAVEIARALKREIVERERITASIGIGPNKLIAKIASDREKPDGLTVVYPERVRGFLDPLPIRVIPGIGPKTEEVLRARGVATVHDLRALPLEALVAEHGKWGGDLYRKARGEDDSPVQESDEVKSVGEQETFGEDTRDLGFLTERLKYLAGEVHRRFTAGGFKIFRTVVLTVRFADFETKSRTHTLAEPSGERGVIEFETLKLLLPFVDTRENPARKKIRLLGVRVEKLT